jgi:hypothetical protein
MYLFEYEKLKAANDAFLKEKKRITFDSVFNSHFYFLLLLFIKEIIERENFK